MKNHNKKIFSVYILFILLTTIFIFSIFPINTVSANAISDISVEPGVVACIVSFTASDISDSFKIYYDTVSGVTTGDSSTYIDPDDTGYNSASHPYYSHHQTYRKMLIWGLTEETTYYYRIYAVGEGWASVESSFTTLERFNSSDVNASFEDWFYDDYLIDTNNNIEIVQQDMSGKEVLQFSAGYSGTGWCFVSMKHNISAKYDAWTNVHDGVHYISDNGTYFIYSDAFGDGTAGRFAKYYEPDNQWYCQDHISEANRVEYLILPDSPYNGTYSSTNFALYRAGWVSSSEVSGDSGIMDTLRCNVLLTTGQCYTSGGTKTRYAGQWFGFNLTDRLALKNSYRVNLGVPDGQSGEQFYMNPYSIEAGTYVCYNTYWNDDNTMDIYLSVSRDGRTWEIVDSSKPLIPRGNPGSDDDGCLYPTTDGIVIDNNEQYLYYVGFDSTHGSGSGTAKRATFREKGYTAIEPTSSSAWFVTTDINQNFTGNLILNGDFDVSNYLDVAVLNATTNNVYNNFNFSDFTTMNTNDTELTASWGTRTLQDIPNGNYKLNFSFTGSDGILYSYEIENNIEENNGIGFQSINNVTNNSIINETINYFNWTKDDNAVYYQLQIANDSGFTDVFVNLIDVNATNYPGNYTETGSYVEFTLPDSYRHSWFQAYYMRVVPWYYYTG